MAWTTERFNQPNSCFACLLLSLPIILLFSFINLSWFGPMAVRTAAIGFVALGQLFNPELALAHKLHQVWLALIFGPLTALLSVLLWFTALSPLIRLVRRRLFSAWFLALVPMLIFMVSIQQNVVALIPAPPRIVRSEAAQEEA